MNLVDNIFVVGVNHTLNNWDQIKSRVNPSIESIYQHPEDANSDPLVFVNTCNRIELYGFGKACDAKKILADKLSVQISDLNLIKGEEAIKHMFQVSCGLNSHLVGEVEILGQFKQSFKEAKSHNRLNGYMERLANSCIQSAKEIRSETNLTKGTTSISYAVIQLLKELDLSESKSFLVLGAGDFAATIAKNIIAYYPQNKLSICNRTLENAKALANAINCDFQPYENLKQCINESTIIVSAVPGNKLSLADLAIDQSSEKIIIDLSVPEYFDFNAEQYGNIKYFSIEDATQIVDDSMSERKQCIPEAKQIMTRHLHEFLEWSKLYEKSHIIKEWKDTVEKATNSCPFLKTKSYLERQTVIKKSMSKFMRFIKENKLSESTNKNVFSDYLNQEGNPECLLDNEECKERNHKCETCSKA